MDLSIFLAKVGNWTLKEVTVHATLVLCAFRWKSVTLRQNKDQTVLGLISWKVHYVQKNQSLMKSCVWLKKWDEHSWHRLLSHYVINVYKKQRGPFLIAFLVINIAVDRFPPVLLSLHCEPQSILTPILSHDSAHFGFSCLHSVPRLIFPY